jgi:hypothetical protein
VIRRCLFRKKIEIFRKYIFSKKIAQFFSDSRFFFEIFRKNDLNFSKNGQRLAVMLCDFFDSGEQRIADDSDPQDRGRNIFSNSPRVRNLCA